MNGAHDVRPGSDVDAGGERDTPMTGVYTAVIVLEAVIIAALWALGRFYS